MTTPWVVNILGSPTESSFEISLVRNTCEDLKRTYW